MRDEQKESIFDNLEVVEGYKDVTLLSSVVTEYFYLLIYKDNINNDLIFFSWYTDDGYDVRGEAEEDGYCPIIDYQIDHNIFISFRAKPELLIRYLYGNFSRYLLLKLSKESKIFLHKIPYIEGREESLDSKGILTYEVGIDIVLSSLYYGTTEYRDLEGEDKKVVKDAIDLLSDKFGVNFKYQPEYQFDYSGLGLEGKDMGFPCFYKELESIDYSHNNITEIPEDFIHCKLCYAKRINLGNNPLSDNAKYNFLLDLKAAGFSDSNLDKIIL